MRILISYEEAYRVYADALERALGGLRPDAEVAVCRLAVIGDQLESFDPDLVVSSRPNTVDPGGMAAWYRLSPSPTNRPKSVSAGGARAGSTRPWRNCCRSSTKWRRLFEMDAKWKAASLGGSDPCSPGCLEGAVCDLRL